MNRRPTSIAALVSGGILLATSPTAWSQISTADLISYWKLDGDLNDAIGANDGTFSEGNPVYVTGFDETDRKSVV